MRVHVFSDLHLEFGPLKLPEAVTSGALAELVLLAGDIDVKQRGVGWAADTFKQPVCMIGGNHEAYRNSLSVSIAACRAAAEEASRDRAHPVRFLERETSVLKATDGTPVRIIAATLWTDFRIFGEEGQPHAMSLAEETMSDFFLIRIRDDALGETRKLTATDTGRINEISRRFLERTLAERFDGITIVMTHHAPSIRSVPADRRADLLTAAYASNEEALIEQFQPALWVHGHVHSSSDYRIGRTRVICNPRGYFPNDLNSSFDPSLTIELQ
jgi:Icc-related predicted phosphoesterase